MGIWSHQLGLFIFAVGAHWQALATGGAVTAAVEVIERKRGKNLSWQSYVIMMATFLLYSVFAAWQDEHRNTEGVIGDKSTMASGLADCRLEARLETEYKRGLESFAMSNRQTIDRQQRLYDKQASDISGCLVSLGKLNPKIREEILVTYIQLATADRKGQSTSRLSLFKKYIGLLLVTTNETEGKFQGTIRCEKPFLLGEGPRVKGTSQSFITGTLPPRAISDREYEVSAFTDGTDWSPARPAYMQIATDDVDVGQCSFTPRGR